MLSYDLCHTISKLDILFFAVKRSIRYIEIFLTVDDKYTRKKNNYNSFSRSFALSENEKHENVMAKYEDCIMKLLILKMEVAKKISRKTEITVFCPDA